MRLGEDSEYEVTDCAKYLTIIADDFQSAPQQGMINHPIFLGVIMFVVIFGRPGCPYCVRAKD